MRFGKNESRESWVSEAVARYTTALGNKKPEVPSLGLLVVIVLLDAHFLDSLGH